MNNIEWEGRGAMIAFGRSVGSKVLMLGASLYLLADAFQQSIVTTPTAWLWPKIALGILVISCMIGILQDLASKPWLHETISATEPRKRRASFLLATGTTIGYVLILPYVGFFFTNLIFLPCFAYVAGYRRLRVIPISVISAVVLSFAFQKLLAVLFPIGTSPFDTATIAIYRMLHIY